MKKTCLTIIITTIIIASLWAAIDWLKDYKKQQTLEPYIKDIITLIEIPENASFHEQIDQIRAYIVNNSTLDMNEEFYSIWRSDEKILNRFLEGINKEKETLVPLECATRTGVMQHLVQKLGYKTRTKYIYNGHNKALLGHVLMDIYNPETKKWESQDPRYDLYWHHIETKQRVSFVEIIGKDYEYEPCNNQKCGWDIISSENEVAEALRKFLSIVSVVDKKAGIRKSFYDSNVVNTDKQFTLNGKTGTFCELIGKNCEDGFIAVLND